MLFMFDSSCRGIIDQFETINIDPSRACEMVATTLVKKGLFEDAIKMFDLAGVSYKFLFCCRIFYHCFFVE